MQHTETLNLNLIQPDDTFSPDPLNENAQALETALSAEAAARDADVAALDARLIQLEAKHLVTNIFTGNGTEQTITLGFTPKFVFVRCLEVANQLCTVVNSSYYYTGANKVPKLKIVTNGFFVKNISNDFNIENRTYHYFAFD